MFSRGSHDPLPAIVKMAAPVGSRSCYVIDETVKNVYTYLGFNNEAVMENTLFHIPYSQRRKHKCDLCFPVVSRNDCTAVVPYTLTSPSGSKRSIITTNIEEVCQDIANHSKEWVIPVKACQSTPNSLCISLDRQKAFRMQVKHVFDEAEMYGSFPPSGKKIHISTEQTSDNISEMDLLQLRMALASTALRNIFHTLGYNVTVGNAQAEADDPRIQQFHISNKMFSKDMPSNCSVIQCGVVLDYRTGVKDTTTTAETYYRRKLEEIKEMSSNRTDYEETEEQAWIEKCLSEAEALAELLFIKLHDHVTIRPSIDSENFNVDHKGAAFMLYNHVRLLAIRRKFEEQVGIGHYPPLPPLNEIDFGLLTVEDEWDLLQLIFRYHSWLRSCVINFEKGKISPHPLLIGLDQLCRTVSVYYRRVRILTEPRTHMLPVMYARLYLLHAVEQVLFNGLTIIGMKTLKQM